MTNDEVCWLVIGAWRLVLESRTGRLAAKTPHRAPPEGWSCGDEGSSPGTNPKGWSGALGSLTIRLPTISAHDVAAACRLAMADVRVQLPLGAFAIQDVGKPGIPRALGARDRWFKSSRPDLAAEK